MKELHLGGVILIAPGLDWITLAILLHILMQVDFRPSLSGSQKGMDSSKPQHQRGVVMYTPRK
jgi:hypothetical protein